MEYNNFLRTYYNTLMDLGTILVFTPQHTVTLNDNDVDEKYIEKKDSGFFGNYRISLGAPNEVIEHEMDRISIQFPEYDALFLNRFTLKKAAESFANIDELKQMLGYIVKIYKEMGLIKV